MTGRRAARFTRWIVLGPVAVLVAMLAVANRHMVRLAFDPLPYELEAPLYLLLLGSVLLGIIIGGSSVWVARRYRVRRKAAREKGELRAIEEEAAKHRLARDITSAAGGADHSSGEAA